MLVSLQVGFSFVRAAVACASLERTSGLEPSNKATAPRYLKLVTVPNFCLLPVSLSGCHWHSRFVISLVFSALLSILYFVQVLSRLSIRASSSCSSSARASMSSANYKPQIGNISATYANLPIMFFQGIRHDPFEKNVEESG